MVSLQLQIQIQIQSISIRTTSWPGKPWTLAVTGGLEENQRSLRFSIIHHVGTLRAVEILRARGDSPGMKIFFSGSLSDQSLPMSVPDWLAQSSIEIWRSQLYLHLQVVPKTCRSDPPVAPKLTRSSLQVVPKMSPGGFSYSSQVVPKWSPTHPQVSPIILK